jgi:capsular polysaccharide transport system permease protein
MTGLTVAKTSDQFARQDRRIRPDEARLGQRYEASRRRRARFLRWTLTAFVATPTVAATLYFALWAAPRYVSETQILVRSDQGGMTAPVGGTALSGLLAAFGVGRSDDDSNAVLNYLQSRSAVSGLEAALPLRKIWGREEADAPARFPRPFQGGSFEHLYWYYENRVTVFSDQDTGIITVQAQAFRPEDAQTIARQLLKQSEALVNEMNARLEVDTVRSAETAVAEAEKAVLSAQEDIDRFRNAEIVVDPTQNAIAQLGTITQLSSQVDQVLAQILANAKTSPTNPTTLTLKAQADALKAQIASEEKALAGSHQAVSNKVSSYERLTLLRSLADASLAAARQALDQARTEARLQHVFVDEIVTPNLPDYPTEPESLRSIATVFGISLMGLFVLWLLSIAVKERQN